MLLLVLLAVAGLALLALAADQLVLGAGRLAAGLGVSPVIVGVVVIGLGTSAPEFVVSGVAAVRGHPDLAAANLVGSNVINLTLVLGLVAVIAPIAVHSSVPRREAPLSVGAVVALAVLLTLGLSRAAGALLAVAAVPVLGLLIRAARVAPPDPLPVEVDRFLDGAPPPARLGRESVRALLGLAGTLLGAHLLVVNAAAAATRLGVSQAAVGFTVVALGTSLPELVTAIQAQRRGDADLLVGNLLGSNLFNSVVGGAVVGLAGTGPPAHLGYPVLSAMVAVSLLTWLVLYRRYRVSRPEGVLLLLAYVMTIPLVS